MPHRTRRAGTAAPVNALSPQRRWRAITLATLLVVPSFWMMLAGVVATRAEDRTGAPASSVSLALGVALVPFVFMLLAFLSEHRRAPSAVLRAMGLSVLVGIPVFSLAGDAVTGLVAGLGSGGIVALRQDEGHNWRARAIAVAASSALVFVLVRIAGPAALLPAPVLPFTALGVADHLSERDQEALLDRSLE